MEDSIDFDEKDLEQMDKQEDIAGYNIGSGQSSTANLQGSNKDAGESFDDDLDGFSSDFNEEESRGFAKCLPSSKSVVDCVLGKHELPSDIKKEQEVKKPSSLFGHKSFN